MKRYYNENKIHKLMNIEFIFPYLDREMLREIFRV